MNDQTPREQPLPPKAEHMRPVEARQALTTGRLRYMLAISVALVVVAFAINLFLAIGYDAFHMSRAHGVLLPGGRSVFSACKPGVSAEAVLADAGLSVSETIPLDPEHGVEMKVWRRPAL